MAAERRRVLHIVRWVNDHSRWNERVYQRQRFADRLFARLASYGYETEQWSTHPQPTPPLTLVRREARDEFKREARRAERTTVGGGAGQ